jgi:L-fuconolactonase
MIDTHVHIWDTTKAKYAWLDNEGPVLNRTYSIASWEQAVEGTNVTAGVLVQAANNLEDTALMLEAATNSDLIVGVVGWLPLQQPDAVGEILEGDFGNNPYIKGVRHLIHNELDPRWLLQPAVIESLALVAAKGLTYDMVGVHNDHLKTALCVAEKVPELYMVFDHLNQPPIAAGEKFGEWGQLMMEAATHSNFFCKISGLGSPSGKPFEWTDQDISPYVEFVLNHFGDERCFCGGDWPVCLLTGEYAQSIDVYEQTLLGLLNAESLQKVLTNNARNFYHL